MTGTIKTEKKLDDRGEWVEIPTYYIDGKVVTFDTFTEAFPDQIILPGQVLGAPSTSGWPMKSDAMAVHNAEIPLARKLDRQRGAPATEYTRAGQPIFTSERHKRAYIKAHGYHDNNSFS